MVIRFETISSTKNIEREIKIRATLEIFQLAILLGVYQTFESWLTRIYLILAVERLKNKYIYIYIYKRKFFVQTRMTRFSKRPEIIYRVEACCESIHPWYRFHGRSGNGRLKQTTREMQFVHLSRCRKKLAARVNEHSSEYLAAACVYIDVEIGPILAQVSATTIPLARFVSLEANRRKSVRSKLAWFLHANINSDKRTVARARYCTH